MSFFKRRRLAGFSLVEIVLTLLLMAILATISMDYFVTETDNVKFDTTRRKIDLLRQAILGDDALDTEGRRKSFGYHGDMGRLPSTLTELVTKGAQPAWAYQTYHGLGTGWRGPYLQDGFTGGPAITLDGWGKTFAYSTASSPPSLTSYGADNKAGGTGYNADISTQFSFNQRMATVKGLALMNDIRLATQTVQIRYPNAVSAFSFANQVTDANGYFSFSSIPLGVRSLTLMGPSRAGTPIPIVVDTSDYQVPTSLFNLGQTVLYVTGTANSTGSGDEIVQASLRSSYTQSLQLAAVTISWSNAGATTGFVEQIQLGGTYETFTPVASGSRITFSNLLSIPSQQQNVNIQLWMSANADGSGTFDTDNYTFTLIFEWRGIPKKDTVVFTVT